MYLRHFTLTRLPFQTVVLPPIDKKHSRGESSCRCPECVKHYVQASCACCETCWLDKRTNMCISGGPFSGYSDPAHDG